MLVEMKLVGGTTWEWEDTSGLKNSWTLNDNVTPKEAKYHNGIKQVLKLKEAGFTAEEIIEMKEKEII